MHPCIVFLPRIDLWAMETQCQSYDGESLSPGCTQSEEFAEISENKDAVRTPSYLWNFFIEQVKSMHVCTSLMILVSLLSVAADLFSKAAETNRYNCCLNLGKICCFCRNNFAFFHIL